MIGRTNSGGGKVNGTDGSIIYLGVGTFFDISTLFPNDYTDFTADNFLVVPTQNHKAVYNCGNGTTWDYTQDIVKTYENGILKISGTSKIVTGTRWGTADALVGVMLIKNPSSLVKIGDSSDLGYDADLIIDIASLYPDSYEDFAEDNFIISLNGERLRQYNVGDGPTSATAKKVVKSYTNGVLTILGLSNGASGERWSNSTLNCDIYLIPNKPKISSLVFQTPLLEFSDMSGAEFTHTMSKDGVFMLLERRGDNATSNNSRSNYTPNLSINGISVDWMLQSAPAGKNSDQCIYAGVVKKGDVIKLSATSNVYRTLLL